MKTSIKNQYLLTVLVAGLGFLLVSRVTAQTFTTLYNFTATSVDYPYTNIDGAGPNGLIRSGNNLYGTTRQGGLRHGTVFSIDTGGTGFTNLHYFNGSDGAYPYVGLILLSNTLFGTTYGDGNPGYGTIFSVNPDGTDFTNLHGFHSYDASGPEGILWSGNSFFGTARSGTASGNGSLFQVNADGTGFTNFHSFTSSFAGPNNDGMFPTALLLSGNTLYGTAYGGGSSGYGTVFAVSTNGEDFVVLHNFEAPSLDYPFTNTDGTGPNGLIISGNTLYGTTLNGGIWGGGTIFRVNTEGTGFTNLHSFTALDENFIANSDGANPQTGLTLLDKTLYGTAYSGGSWGNGVIFSVRTDGTGFTNLHNFAGKQYNPALGAITNSDGMNPQAGLISSGNTLYGTTSAGGASGSGTVFSLSFPPQLTIAPSGADVILTWPTNYGGFDYSGFALQSTTNLVPPAIWNTVSPPPVAVNGQNTVTNSISGTQQFFRLSQ